MSIFGFLDNLASSAKGEAVDLIAEGSLAGAKKTGAGRSSSLRRLVSPPGSSRPTRYFSPLQDYMEGMERGRRGVGPAPRWSNASPGAAGPSPYPTVAVPPPAYRPPAAVGVPAPAYRPPAPVSVPLPSGPFGRGDALNYMNSSLSRTSGDIARPIMGKGAPAYGPPLPGVGRNYVAAPGAYDNGASRYLGGAKIARTAGPVNRRASIVDNLYRDHLNPPPFRKNLPGYRTGDLDRAFESLEPGGWDVDDVVPRSPGSLGYRDTTPIPGAGPRRVSARKETTQVRPPRRKKIYGGPQAQAVQEERQKQILAQYGSGRPSPQSKAQGRVGKILRGRHKPGPVLSATGGAPTSGRSSGGLLMPKTPPMAAPSGKPARHFAPTWDRVTGRSSKGSVPGAPPPPKKRWPGPQGRRKVPRYVRKQAARVAGLPGVPAGSHRSWGAAAPPVPQPLPSGPAAMAGVAKGRRPGSHTAGYTRYKQGQAAAHQVMTSSVQRGPGGRRLLPTKRGMKGTLHANPQSWSRRNRVALGALGAGAIGANVLAGNAYQGRSRRHPTSRAPQMPGGMPY